MPSLADAVDNNDRLAQAILKGIEDDIKEKADAIYERHLEEIKNELSAVRTEVVASAALRMAKHSSVEYLHDKIIVEILDRRDNG